MSKNLIYYNDKFANLKVDRASGVPAPHQPILLLSVIEQFERGKISHNQIYLTPELIATFLKYWSNLVTTDHHSDISLPFFHLSGKKKIKFWHLMPNPGFEAVTASGTRIKGLSALPILRTKTEQILRLKPLFCRGQDLFFQVRGRANVEKIA